MTTDRNDNQPQQANTITLEKLVHGIQIVNCATRDESCLAIGPCFPGDGVAQIDTLEDGKWTSVVLDLAAAIRIRDTLTEIIDVNQ